MKNNFLILILLPFICFSQKKVEVFFDFNKDIPNAISQQRFMQWIKDNKGVEVLEIQGFCDSIDDNNYNNDLANRRIKTVSSLLKANQIAFKKNVTFTPFGKNFKQSKNQEQNRKVVVFYEAKIIKTILKNDENQVLIDTTVSLSSRVELEKVSLAKRFSKAKKGDIIRIQNINYQLNSEKIVSASIPLLDELHLIMLDNPKLKIDIHGHICCNPNPMDTSLSYRRAMGIFNFLHKRGIALNRLSYKGIGSFQPIYSVPERNEAERAANRRVEILIVEK
jgi:outer membrane protein OmpA-like peptidoglycan-associated protein